MTAHPRTPPLAPGGPGAPHDPGGPHGPADRLRRRRERHRERGLAYRSAFATLGFATVVAGVLMIPLPPLPGVPVILIGLGMLALEFHWAERALGRLLGWLPVIRARLRRTSRPQRILAAATILVLAATGVLGLVTL